MVIETVDNRAQWTIQEKAVQLEAEWLGYTLEKLPGKNFSETDHGGYRLLKEGEVHKGGNSGLGLVEIELILRGERSAITDRLLDEWSETEKKTQNRFKKIDFDLYKERQRILIEYLEAVSRRLQIVDIYMGIIRSRLEKMDRAAKEEMNKIQIIELDRQIQSMALHQTDISCLISIRGQLQFEIEKGQIFK